MGTRRRGRVAAHVAAKARKDTHGRGEREREIKAWSEKKNILSGF